MAARPAHHAEPRKGARRRRAEPVRREPQTAERRVDAAALREPEAACAAAGRRRAEARPGERPAVPARAARRAVVPERGPAGQESAPGPDAGPALRGPGPAAEEWAQRGARARRAEPRRWAGAAVSAGSRGAGREEAPCSARGAAWPGAGRPAAEWAWRAAAAARHPVRAASAAGAAPAARLEASAVAGPAERRASAAAPAAAGADPGLAGRRLRGAPGRSGYGLERQPGRCWKEPGLAGPFPPAASVSCASEHPSFVSSCRIRPAGA